MTAADDDLVWYVSYGSNMCAERFGCYLGGGRPSGASRDYPGCRDTADPVRTVPLWLPGRVYFAWDSPVWAGGVAFYDPDAPGPAPARGYLITAGQFSDVAAQEMHRPPGRSLDLAAVLQNGRAQVGPGRYETLLCLGRRDGHPLLTLTAPWPAAEVEHTTPAPAYLAMLHTGLMESHGFTAEQAGDYLTPAPRTSATPGPPPGR